MGGKRDESCEMCMVNMHRTDGANSGLCRIGIMQSSSKAPLFSFLYVSRSLGCHREAYVHGSVAATGRLQIRHLVHLKQPVFSKPGTVAMVTHSRGLCHLVKQRRIRDKQATVSSLLSKMFICFLPPQHSEK